MEEPNPKLFRPLLSADIEEESWIDQVKWPKLASRKYNGFRAIFNGEVLVSRNNLPIPNRFVQEQVKKYPEFLRWLDGELIVGDDPAKCKSNHCSSAFTTSGGQPNFGFYVFDVVWPGAPYTDRYSFLKALANKLPPFVHVVDQIQINNKVDFLKLERSFVDKEHYEGIMIRNARSMYKYGRSTFNEQILMKYKRFFDAEGRIVALEEQMENTNRADKNAFGLTKRSSAKAGKVGKGTLGKFVLDDCPKFPGRTLKVGTGKGLTERLRKEIWDNKEKFLGQYITFSYQEVGENGLPIFPSYQHFRHPIDR